MPWANLLHFYQPYGQKRAIIDAITEQCYRPVAEGILAEPRARVTVNFTGVLLDQLAQYGHQDVIDLYAEAVRRGQVELVGSAKYHAILPLLPEAEAARQIEINDETNRRYFGSAYARKGIFLPEMAWDPKLAPLLERLGFEWVLLDELAYNGRVGAVDYNQGYVVEGTDLRALFREHRLSAAIMSAAPRQVEQLKAAAGEDLRPDRAIITAMDGETFGHHRIGHEQLLFGMFRDPELELAGMSEMVARFGSPETVPTVACTWASSQDDIERGIQFISWDDPDNDIHKLQWELLRLVVAEVERQPVVAQYEAAREQLDYALASDQFFWAAAKPWWMIEHIERGAHDLLAAVRQAGNPKAADEAEQLYHRIVDLAWEWQRTGKIDRMHGQRAERVRVPFKAKTREAGDPQAWQAIIDLMQQQEQAAAARGDYEAAILWRDGAYKLEHKLDIYDGWYILDILHAKLPKGEIEATIAQYKAKFDQLRGGQVEQRSN